MIICSVNKIAKMYGGNTIFEEISFEVKEGERVGLVGRNGSGKSTLFRLLSGEEVPDNGEIHWKKGLQIGYLAQSLTYPSEITVKDVLYRAFAKLISLQEKITKLEREMSEEISGNRLEQLMRDYGEYQDQFAIKGGYEIEASIEKVVDGLNIKALLYEKFSQLSGGEQTKVGLALTLLKKPDLLLLDEPTNHLDLMAVEWLGAFLKDYPGTVVIVSHDRYFMDEVVTKVLDLEDGEIIGYLSNFSGYVKEKEARLLREFQAYEEQQKKIKKMKEAIKRLREWANQANPPNEGLHKRARNMERALERMEKLDRPILQRKKMGFEVEAADRSGKDVVMLKDVTKRFADRTLFKQVNMHITYQDRVAIIGENGTGKSTLINLILNNLSPDEGEVLVGSNVKIGYLSQHTFLDSSDITIIEAFREDIHVTEGEARHILARFLFYGHAVFRKVTQLSGGEKMRLRLAQLMYHDINLLVLDEPTNHLDIESREVLEEALEEYNGTILVVSHDRYFINKLFEKIYWIQSQQLHYFEGNYDYAKVKMAEKLVVQEQPVKRNKTPRKQISNRNSNPKRIEEVEKIEAKIIEIEKQLMETNDLNVLQQLYDDKELLEGRWEELCKEIGQ
ncbi:ribosomal protection-like ABC-F family protein [Ornithinibacillus contaminans]|uniref:ribosomal protection-like ABC-F family protein n=1 Tax=Ornithinibacillus contaminans TaxID=694055 RepID=UPI00064D9DF2|nr:ABC-F type ribosomal protection protein [Ornithinibacillus contaminans]